MKVSKKAKLVLLILYFTGFSIAAYFYPKQEYKPPPIVIKVDDRSIQVKPITPVFGDTCSYGCSQYSPMHHWTLVPPPWKDGNCMKLDWENRTVINMTYENFHELNRNLSSEPIKVERVGKHGCIIVDPRISRGWFRDKPYCLLGNLDREEVLIKYAENFSIKTEQARYLTISEPKKNRN